MEVPSFLTHVFKEISPSAVDLIRREALRLKDDQVLIAHLISTLSSLNGSSNSRPAALPTIVVPNHTHLGQWVDVFLKALTHDAFLDWARNQSLDLTALRIRGSRLSAMQNLNGTKQLADFTLGDTTGWRRYADPILSALQIIDLGQAGISVVPTPVGDHGVELPLNLVLAFYGYPTPGNRWQAQVIVDELMSLASLPGIDDSGQIKSTVPDKLMQEQRDYHQLADELQATLANDNTFKWLQVYGRRLILRSDSMLSRSLKAAAAALERIVESDEFLELNPEDAAFPTAYHYSVGDQAIVSVGPQRTVHTRPADRSDDNRLNRQWDELVRLGELLQIDFLADASLSLAALMNAYHLPRPTSAGDAQAQADRLRGAQVAAMPYVSTISHSLAAVSQHLRYIAVLNDRHRAHRGLASITHDNLVNPVLESLLELDPHSPLNLLINTAAQQLIDLSRDPAFMALMQQHGIDNTRYLWVDAGGHLTGYDQDGAPKRLPVPLSQVAALSAKATPLLQLVKRTGGRIGTDARVSLRQLLTLYQIEIPATRGQAVNADRLLTIAMPRSPLHGNYWNALQVAPLLPDQRQQVLQTVEAFLPSRDITLFDYLSQTITGQTNPEDTRAEADLLLAQLLASPRAQRLAGMLSQAVRWHGVHATASSTRTSRNELLMAALVLSLDPEAGNKRGYVLGYDLTDQHNWGISFNEVYKVIRALVGMKLADATAVPLATHLLLAGVAPEFLVQAIPDSVPYMSSHTWVHVKQLVDAIERDSPGAARGMRFADFLALIYLLEQPKRVRRGNQPIIDWAVANGVLPKSGKAYTTDETNLAVSALNNQINQLQRTAKTLEAPPISARRTALDALKERFPQHLQLETPLFWWQPEASSTAQNPMPGLRSGQLFSLVELHMANRLHTDPKNWRTRETGINYPQMAEAFAQLTPHHQVFGEQFRVRLEAVRSAHLVSMRYWLSQLSVYSREALERGALDFFSLRRAGTSEAARFGFIVYCHYPGASRAYECFPRQLEIRPRGDLTFQALSTPTRNTLIPLDWAAYNDGDAPGENGPVKVFIERFAQLPAVQSAYIQVPDTFNSPRSLAIATILVDQRLLAGSAELQKTASQPMSLVDAVSREETWAAFIAKVTPVLKR